MASQFVAEIQEGERRMRKLVMFNNVTLDGFFAGVNGDISWFKRDAQTSEYAIKMTHSGNTLIFGRVTYQLMAGYWPTPPAMQNDPIMAEGMNSLPKIVFSRTLDKADWSNTRLVKTDMPTEIRKLKQQPGKDMAILGSGSIVSQLTQQGLIDEYQFMVNPVVLGKGRTLFEGSKDRLTLKLTQTRTFANGNVLLSYEPAK
jgi:dihydrofolate reductase